MQEPKTMRLCKIEYVMQCNAMRDPVNEYRLVFFSFSEGFVGCGIVEDLGCFLRRMWVEV